MKTFVRIVYLTWLVGDNFSWRWRECRSRAGKAAPGLRWILLVAGGHNLLGKGQALFCPSFGAHFLGGHTRGSQDNNEDVH